MPSYCKQQNEKLSKLTRQLLKYFDKKEHKSQNVAPPNKTERNADNLLLKLQK